MIARNGSLGCGLPALLSQRVHTTHHFRFGFDASPPHHFRGRLKMRRWHLFSDIPIADHIITVTNEEYSQAEVGLSLLLVALWLCGLVLIRFEFNYGSLTVEERSKMLVPQDVLQCISQQLRWQCRIIVQFF